MCAMNYNFTGAITQRKINLGSAHEISSAQLAQQAREDRAVRHEIRLRHAAATKIQSTVRGRYSAQAQRLALRQRLQEAESSNFARRTALVSLATQRHAIVRRLEDAGRLGTLSKGEERVRNQDVEVLRQWALCALEPSEQVGGESIWVG